MKPETHCPQCQHELDHGQDDLSRYDLCRNCSFDFCQRYIGDSAAVSYVSFEFPGFFATIYFDNWDRGDHWPSNTIMIYSRADMDLNGKVAPIVKTLGFIPDWSRLKALQTKISVLITFS